MIMIEVKFQNGEHKLFNGYHEFCNYINGIEMREALISAKKPWSFSRRKYETLYSLCGRDISLTLKEQEAIEKKKGLIEIVKGERGYITQILFSRHFDIEPLKRDWCHEYCLKHRIQISEWIKSEDIIA